MTRPALKPTFQPAKAPEPAPRDADHPAPGATGTVSARIDPRITTALLRASVERRIQGQTPHMQRDIIAEALTTWLKKHGYLT
jgi:hypothetical protein